MNSFNGDAFSGVQNSSVEGSASRVNNSQDLGLPTPNGVVGSHHGKDSNHHSKIKEEKREHSSKDKHRDHKHKDHKHSKEHKSKENHVSSSKDHSSSKQHHHHSHKDDKPPKDKTKEKSKDGHSKDKDPSKHKHSSGDKDKHKSKEGGEKHKSDKHKSSSKDSTASGEKPKDTLKLVIKPKDGSVHSLEKQHSSSKHSSSEKQSSSDKHKKHSSSSSSEKHSSEKTKHSSSSSSSNKHEKHDKTDKVKSESGHKEKHKEEKHNKMVKEEKMKIKTEPVMSPVSVKTEVQSEDESSPPPPQRQMVGMKSPSKMDRSVKKEDEESDDEPLAIRMEKVKKKKGDSSLTKKRKHEDEDFKPVKKNKVQKDKPKNKRPVVEDETPSPKKGKKQEEEQEVWKWWEEEKKEDGVKWKTLQHNGPVFAPDYVPLPKSVKFYYDGKHMELTSETEEVAGFYGRMLDHDYVTKESFNKNYFKDWKKVMSDKEKEIIKDLSKCNFKEIDAYYKMKSEERKAMTKEEKLVIKKENEALQAKYGFCIIDGHKQKIGNFKIEPPGLFRGRGEHPKMGMLKRRVNAKDIIINIGKGAQAPEPPPGQKWKEVRHDNTVTWLACWTENILGSNKYIMLNPSSKLKGEKDWQKYELARKLKSCAEDIRDQYQNDWRSKEMRVRQRAVALYFIDKLALRAGNEKEEGETADTVGCCSLRVEHITLDDEKDGKECVVTFDFLGKDSIRYINSVPVEKRVFKNLKLFMENKQPGDDLFDRLNTSILNKYLNDLMEGLTAKVFRTYNASKTLQEQLDKLTEENMSIPEKLLAYNRANRAVAILCNHQRSVPKTFDKQMENLQTKIQEKEQQIREHKKEMKAVKDSRDKSLYEKKKKRLKQLEEQLQKLEVQATDKEENKQIALGTSKLNYLDPRISVAWCKKWGVPIEKIYNKTQRDKFRWAIEMATPEYKF